MILLQETDLKKFEKTLIIDYKQVTCANTDNIGHLFVTVFALSTAFNTDFNTLLYPDSAPMHIKKIL